MSKIKLIKGYEFRKKEVAQAVVLYRDMGINKFSILVARGLI